MNVEEAHMLSDHVMFSIKETSEQAGLSEDTIRYYEKIGLIPRAERKPNRHRVYRSEDIHTMKLITCLKNRNVSGGNEALFAYVHRLGSRRFPGGAGKAGELSKQS